MDNKELFKVMNYIQYADLINGLMNAEKKLESSFSFILPVIDEAGQVVCKNKRILGDEIRLDVDFLGYTAFIRRGSINYNGDHKFRLVNENNWSSFDEQEAFDLAKNIAVSIIKDENRITRIQNIFEEYPVSVIQNQLGCKYCPKCGQEMKGVTHQNMSINVGSNGKATLGEKYGEESTSYICSSCNKNDGGGLASFLSGLSSLR